MGYDDDDHKQEHCENYKYGQYDDEWKREQHDDHTATVTHSCEHIVDDLINDYAIAQVLGTPNSPKRGQEKAVAIKAAANKTCEEDAVSEHWANKTPVTEVMQLA